jgi:regulator of sigma D
MNSQKVLSSIKLVNNMFSVNNIQIIHFKLNVSAVVKFTGMFSHSLYVSASHFLIYHMVTESCHRSHDRHNIWSFHSFCMLDCISTVIPL